MNSSLASTIKNPAGLICAGFLLFLACINVDGQTLPSTNLESGKPIERSLKGGDTHEYQLELKAGQFIQTEVRQAPGLDVVVSLFAPDNKLLVDMNAADGALWREDVSCVAAIAGVYRIEVKRLPQTASVGSYTITMGKAREPNDLDRKRVAAEAAFSEGRRIYLMQGNKAKDAMKHYEQAADLWAQAGDKYWEAVARTNIGLVQKDLAQNDDSLRSLQQALGGFQAVRDKIGEGKALDGLSQLLLLSKAAHNIHLEADVSAALGQYYYGAALFVQDASSRRSALQNALANYTNACSLYQQLPSADALVARITCTRSIGTIYGGLNDPEHALPSFLTSLRLLSSLERSCPACDLHVPRFILDGDIALAYFTTGREDEALRYLKQIDFERTDYWKDDKATPRYLLGLLEELLVSLGDVEEYDYSIKTYQWILQHAAEYDYQEDDLMGLNISLGKAYTEAGYYDMAKACYDRALQISLSIQERLEHSKSDADKSLSEQASAIESTARNNIGIIYLRNGDFAEALNYIQAAFDVAKKHNDSLSIIKWKANLAGIFAREKRYDVALKDFDETIPKLKSLRNEYAANFASTKDLGVRVQEKNLAAFVGIDLYYYGTILRETNRINEAVRYHNESIQTLKEYGFRKFEARARVELGLDYLSLNHPDLAEEQFRDAYLLASSAKARDEQSASLDGLMRAMEVKNNASLAIIYGKQSVNLLQKTRAELERLGKSTASEFVKDNEATYRRLVDLLISTGRYPEAQAVLDLLKDEEYKTITRSNESPGVIPYSDTEEEVMTKVENLVALERERDELQRHQKENATLSSDQLALVTKIESEIEKANNAFEKTLDALKNAEKNSAIRVDDLKNGEELQGALTRLSKKTNARVVALYTVLGTQEIEDRNDIRKKTRTKFGWVIMVTPGFYKAYPIKVESLEETVFAFLRTLSSDKYDPQPWAEKIYAAIFRQISAKQNRTLEQDLQDYLGSSKNKTIMWSLDGVLRYIPMSALHDGRGYLVEHYRNIVFTKNSLVSLTEDNQDAWNALGVGISEKREDFSALPGVKIELETLIREPNKQGGILNGKIELNDNFQKQRFFSEVRSGAFPVVHIASHYSFNPARSDESFLLVGDGHLTFAEMREKKNLFGTLDLLTLSACDTGVSGNGKEAEGFAYLAQYLGAKSVIASLWPVDDIGTQVLMPEFYRLHETGSSKSEALQRAQLALLSGEIREAPGVTRSSQIQSDKQTQTGFVRYVPDPKKPFAHPYYWAPFILIGNWR